MAELEKSFNFDNIVDEGIADSIRKHQELGATDTPLYKALVEERARRSSKVLKPEKTLNLLVNAAKAGTYVTYKDVAEASGLDFSKVRYQVGKHLDAILDVCFGRGWPLLTALCVKQNEKATGNLSGDSLKGFIGAAKRLRYPVTDPEAFLKKCQAECREWAKGQ